ncbi:MAG: hypothetical protein R3F43_27820 [bacterium]
MRQAWDEAAHVYQALRPVARRRPQPRPGAPELGQLIAWLAEEDADFPPADRAALAEVFLAGDLSVGEDALAGLARGAEPGRGEPSTGTRPSRPRAGPSVASGQSSPCSSASPSS